ncbi:MAG: hypothetical protein WB699_02405, partial [Bacteroidota bacterium]
VERTRILLFLLDATNPDPKADYEVLLSELKAFNKTLIKKPRLVALTKMDAVDEAGRKRLSSLRFGRTTLHRISAPTGEGISDLIAALGARLSVEKSHAKVSSQ